MLTNATISDIMALLEVVFEMSIHDPDIQIDNVERSESERPEVMIENGTTTINKQPPAPVPYTAERMKVDIINPEAVTSMDSLRFFTPEIDETLTTAQERNTNKKRFIKIGAAGVGVLGISAGALAFALRPSNDSESVRAEAVPTSELFDLNPSSSIVDAPTTTVTASSLPPQNSTPSPTQPEASSNEQIAESLEKIPTIVSANLNFDVSENAFADRPSTLSLTDIEPNERFITIQRDGQEFKVPHLRDPRINPKEFLESALAEWAWYLTSGDENDLKVFSPALSGQTTNEVQEILIKQRLLDFEPYQEAHPDRYAQAGFTDRYEDPVKVVYNEENGVGHVTVTEGTLLFGIVDYDPLWQSLSPNLKRMNAKFTKLRFDVQYINENGIERPVIIGLHFDLENI